MIISFLRFLRGLLVTLAAMLEVIRDGAGYLERGPRAARRLLKIILSGSEGYRHVLLKV